MEDLKFLFKKNIRREDLITDGDNIILALSGGADSMSLLHLLLDISDDISIFAIHINHNLREDESDRDEAFVRKKCQDLNIELKTVSVDCKSYAEKVGISLEEAGRILRYEAFDSFADELFSRGVKKEKIKIATAHNRDDQVETVFFRFIRGASIDGLSGILPSRFSSKGYKVIRPILSISRSDIEEFCVRDNIEFVNDSTNYENDYTRNLIRNDILPSIEEKMRSDISSAILRFSNISKEDSNFISKHVDIAYEDIVSRKLEKIYLDKSKISNLDRAISSRLILRVLKDIGILKDLQFSHVESILDLISEEKGYRYLNLPKGFIIEVSYDSICIYRKDDSNLEEVDFSKFSFRILEDEEQAFHKENIILVPKEFIKDGIEIRTRKTGDYIYINPYSKKTIKKLLIDEKVPLAIRDKILLVVSGNNVFYIHGGNGLNIDVDYGLLKARYIPKFENEELISIEILTSVL